ncbi:hypothetical protein [Bittarella massiliensis (ex Durand et al. 2017)]|uniref:hypothetical protein n=1 Tax=Bittarella massiliensis (ex Durand et al. 2017) TaxID=1720313 RepID=UPI001AA0D3F0|nr:hypothetical protein [Bittarella massiliensis (ex Durand et al. 2017)]MBO1679375.1 hypothetical protein [Bittarella massiliensis (ex Durand et al. 2017)]
MKKGLCLFLALCCCLMGLTGCLNYGDEEAEEPQQEVEKSFVEWLWEEYREKAETYGLAYNVEDGIYRDSEFGKEEFEVETPDKKDNIASMYPSVDTKGNYLEEYDLYFDPQRQASGLRDLLTATFLIWDESLDEAGAREKVKELIDSYSTDKYSKIVECGEMRVVICPNSLTFRVWVYKASRYGFSEVNEEEYEPITPELYDIELNAGTKVVAEGEISWIHLPRARDVAGLATVRFVDDTGKEYRTEYAYDFHGFIEFEVGQRIRVYGDTGKTLFGKRIYADRIEVVE